MVKNKINGYSLLLTGNFALNYSNIFGSKDKKCGKCSPGKLTKSESSELEEKQKKQQKNGEISEDELSNELDDVEKMIEKAIKCILSSGDKTKLMLEISELEGKIDSMEKQFQQHHIDRLTKQQCTAEAGMIFSDVISGLERVSDHALNIVRYLQRRDLAELTE